MTGHEYADELAIVIVSHNRLDDLRCTLDTALRVSENSGYAVFVVDNCSTDGSVDFLRSVEAPGFTFLESPVNLGVAAGRNLGWARARGRYILSLDDDAYVDAESIRSLISFMDANPSVGVASPTIVHFSSGRRQTPVVPAPARVANFHGACHIVRRAAYEQVGELDRNCDFGGEEFEYSLRMRCAGWEIAQLDSVVVRHNSFERSGVESVRRRELWVYNYTRVVAKYFPRARSEVLAGRILALHVRSAARTLGPGVIPPLVGAWRRGRKAGRVDYVRMPAAVQRFYRDRTLLPEYGNHTLFSKVLSALRR